MKNSPIIYNEDQKIWHRGDYPHQNFIRQSVGEAFLKSMRSIDKQKVLEYYHDTKETQTAEQIYTEAVTVALNLQRLGIKKGDVVVLYMLLNPQVTPLAFGCYLIGAVVSYCDTQLSQEYIEQLLEEMQPSALFYQTQYWQDIKDILPKYESLKVILPSSDNLSESSVKTELLTLRGPQEQIEQFEACHVEEPENEICSLLLTSGSTGRPKLAQITNSLLLHGITIWWPVPLEDDSVLFSFSPLRWISQVAFMCQTVLFGVKRICTAAIANGDLALQIYADTKVTHVFATPAVYANILQALDDTNKTALDTIQCLMLGGEPISDTALELACQKTRNAKVFNSYGMTEAFGPMSHAGCLFHGIEVKVLDAQRKPVGPGVPGQIAIRTVVPISGYLKRDNSKIFLDDGFFVNGDYGFVDADGKLHVKGRYKDLIKAENVTIVPDTVENMIGSLPEIFKVGLVPYQSNQTQNDIGALFVVPSKQNNGDEDSLRVKIREVYHNNLQPSEAAVLQDIHIMPTLPLTSCGKLDRVALKGFAGTIKQSLSSIYAQLCKELELLDS